VSELVEARHLDSRVRLVHSGRSHRFAADFEDHCRWLLDRGIGIVNMPLDDWTGERLDIARCLGVGVFASLINDAERMRRALAVGVEAVYTDRVAAMVGLLAGES
jgi:glycerophosphoryl diester phosphodiesterase